jgi:hypothetical protein
MEMGGTAGEKSDEKSLDNFKCQLARKSPKGRKEVGPRTEEEWFGDLVTVKMYCGRRPDAGDPKRSEQHLQKKES